MSYKLCDLNPKLEGTLQNGVLRFDCPLHDHKLRVPLGSGQWQYVEGSFPDTLSVSPSVDASHPLPSGKIACTFHMTLVKGEFV